MRTNQIIDNKHVSGFCLRRYVRNADVTLSSVTWYGTCNDVTVTLFGVTGEGGINPYSSQDSKPSGQRHAKKRKFPEKNSESIQEAIWE